MSFSRNPARPVATSEDIAATPAAATATTAANGRGTVARKPRVADMMGGPKRRSQPPPPPPAKPKKESKGESKKVPTGGDGDDDGDDDAHGGEHDDGPYIFQASRPKDAPQYRMSKSIFNHRGGIRMDMITGAMLQLGWTEEPDAESLAFDLQWALSAKHLQRERLKPKQIINHFQGIGCVTTKIQLCKNLRTLAKPHCDTFFPRCFAVCESKEFDAFVKQYQSQAAISVLIKYINLKSSSSSSSDSSSSSSSSTSSSSSSSASSTAAVAPTGQSIPPLLTRTVVTLALHATQAYIKKMRYSPIARDVSWKDEKSSASVPATTAAPSATEEAKIIEITNNNNDEKDKSTAASSAVSKGKTIAKKAGSVYRRSNDLSRTEWQAVVRCAESLRPHSNTVAAKKATTTAATAVPVNAPLINVDLKTNGDVPSPATPLAPIVPYSPIPASASSGSAATTTTMGTSPGGVAVTGDGPSPPKPLRQGSTRPSVVRQRSSAPPSPNEPSGVTPVTGPLFDDKLVAQVQASLDELKELDPQFYYSGEYNVWILKPGTQSRGRGIQVCDSLPKIVREMRADVSGRWVIQKYLERPIAIHRKKFDIRQWMVVTQFGTSLRAWFYEDCYLRFSSQDFDLSDLSGGIHLTNNAIQAKLKDFDNGNLHQYGIKGNMWSMNQFAAWLETTYGPVDASSNRRDPLVESGGGDADGFGEDRRKYSIWHQRLRPKMRAVAQAIMETVRDRIIPRSHSFEIYGLDFMFDENLQPWLLEVNSAPTLMHIAVDGLVDTMCLDMLTVVLADHHRMLNEEAAEAAEKAKADAAAAAAAASSSTTTGGNGRSMQRGAGSPTNRGSGTKSHTFGKTPSKVAAKKTMIGRTSSATTTATAATAAAKEVKDGAVTTEATTPVTTTELPAGTLPPPSLDIVADTSSATTDATSSPSPVPPTTTTSATVAAASSTAPIPTTSTMGALALPGSKFRLIYEHRLASRERASKSIARMRAFKDSYNANRLALTQPGSQRIPVGQAQHLL